ncbi:MAG TPA: hypothetical protein VGE26_10265 [Sphingobacteriaceae bacterium]
MLPTRGYYCEEFAGVGDDEAIRVLKDAPAWRPGKQIGQSVRVAYTMPVNFRHAQ